MAGDLHWDNVSLLIGFEDKSDGDTSATDESPVGRSLTFNGAGIEVDNAQAKFGTKSVVITSSSDIQATKTSDLSLANTNDMTLEAWIRPASLGRANTMMNGRDSSGGEEFSFAMGATNILGFTTFSASSAVAESTSTIAADVWTHVAATRHFDGMDRTIRVFINGTLDGSDVETITPGSNSAPFRIGRSGFLSSRWFDGWLDEIRVTSGVARYISNFTAPTARFPRGPIRPPRVYYDRLLAGGQ